jgi:hypothetical protein
VTCLGLRTDTQLGHGCKDALGVRAGASITVRGRLCARKEGDMSADADDLLERAARAEELDIRTLDELKAELADALDEFERRFPNGRPPRGSGSDGLGYQTLLLRISNYRWQLQNGDYREFPREELHSDQTAPADPSWEAFVESHPELAAPPTFIDDDVIAALRTAIEEGTQPWLQGAVHSGDVLAVLMPGARATPLVVRTGKHLARLAREGRVVRLRRKWTKGRGSSIWSLPGIEINEWWFKQFEVDDA